MALINPCSVSATPSNTGAECKNSLKATAMLVMVPKSAKWSDSDLLDFEAFLNTKIHAAPDQRFFPIFGNNAPIRGITEANEADVTETMEDGSMHFIRYGMYNRTFLTTEGGIEFAKALMAMGQNYSFIEIDIIGQVLMMKNSDGTYSGVPVNLAYAPVPELANLKTTYKNKYMLSYSPNNYIKKGVVFASDSTEDILSLRGLYDTQVTAGSTTQTTTNIFIDISTIVGGTDLVALHGTALAALYAQFPINKVSDNSAVVATAGTVIGGELRLTGTFASGSSYKVGLPTPAQMKTGLVEGYECTVKGTVAIP